MICKAERQGEAITLRQIIRAVAADVLRDAGFTVVEASSADEEESLGSRPPASSYRHRDLNTQADEIFGRPDEGAGNGGNLRNGASDGNADEVRAAHRSIGGVEHDPAGSR